MPAFRTIVVTVDDLDAAKRVYSIALGVEPHTDTPYYVGYNVDDCEFGLSPKPGDGRDGSVPYVDHADIDKAVADLVAAGASVVISPTDVGAGTKIAVLADADGNRFGVRSWTAP